MRFDNENINDSWCNILVSYAWLGASGGQFIKNLIGGIKDHDINVMIDSGAFTLHGSANSSSYKHINLDSYCNFLNVYGEYVQKYVMLDKINDEAQSKKNYEEMLKRGLNPMYVFTMFDDDYDYLNAAIDENPFVCVAGGVATKGDWMSKRYQDVYKNTDEKALIHGLGYVTYPKMFQLPLQSVDSSSWAQSAMMFGNLCYYDNGMKTIAYKDILTKKKRIPEALKRQLERFKVTPKMFSDTDNHKGGISLGLMLSIVAWFEYQQVAKRQELDLFLSIGGDTQLQKIIYIKDKLQEGTLTYENFKSRS